MISTRAVTSYGTKIILLAALLLSCSKEEGAYHSGGAGPAGRIPSEELVFTAGQDAPSAYDCTRSSLNGMKVLFSAGDSVSLLSAKNANVVLTTTLPGAKVSLSGAGADDSRYYAVYPFTPGAALNGTSITGFSIPSEQTAAAGTYDPKASITFAASANTSLQFHNLCALLKITPDIRDGQTAVSRVTVSFKGTRAAAGSVTISDIDGTGRIVSEDAASSEVTLEGDIADGEDYFIAIAPNTYTFVCLSAFGSSGERLFTRTSGASAEFSPGRIYDMGDILVIGRGMSNGHPWVQLKAGGPKWAEFNLGSSISDYAQATGDNALGWGASGSVWNATNCGGFYDNLGSSGVAAVWPGWKMPKAADVQDDLCGSGYVWEWCDGVTSQYVPGCTLTGYKISGKGDYSGNSIFLPAAGYFYYSKSDYRQTHVQGHYFYGVSGKALKFYKGFRDALATPVTGSRCSVRPVAE